MCIHVAWYLSLGILILFPLSGDWPCLSSSQNSPSLITLPILPAWLLVNQHFIKPIQVTNLYRVQQHFLTAYRRPMPSFFLCHSTSHLSFLFRWGLSLNMVLTGEAGWPVSPRESLISPKPHHWDYVIVCVPTLSAVDSNLHPHAFVVSTLLTQATS